MSYSIPFFEKIKVFIAAILIYRGVECFYSGFDQKVSFFEDVIH